MEFKRYTEKTLEEALKSAASDKGVSVEDLHYNEKKKEVIDKFSNYKTKILVI